jgi:putative flippase GtrA
MRDRLLRFFDAAFGRYAMTSAAATATDFALFSLLSALGLGAGSATFFGCVAGGSVAFSLSRRWTFQPGAGHGPRGPLAPALPQMLRFLFGWATSALLNSAGVLVLVSVLGSPAVAWAVVRAAVYLGWNYPLSRWFVFATEKDAAALSAP